MTHTTLVTPTRTPLWTPIRGALYTRTGFWFVLSLLFAATYGVLGLIQAFASPYVVQDDARVHVFWMQRFVDPDLFPNDLIADYFQSVAPAGYTGLYQAFAGIGVEPLLLNKLLPIFLGLVATIYCFGVSLSILPSPVAAFASALILSQSLWLKDDLASATPRAFLYPLFLAFLYYVLRGSLLPCLVAIVLQGLFYPQLLFISAGILVFSVAEWKGGLPRPTKDRARYRFCAAGLGVALLVMALYALQASDYGPVMTAVEARTIPQFQRGGRTSFFVDDPWRFWVTQQRTGILPPRLGPPLIWTSVLLPVLWLFRSRLPLAGRLTSRVALLPQIVVVSLAMFLVAHALVFKLHLPSRYTEHSLRVVMALAAGIALTVVADEGLRWGRRQGKPTPDGRRLLSLGLTGLVGAGLVLYPAMVMLAGGTFPYSAYRAGEHPPLYEFFARQPKQTLIASLSGEANHLPAFTQRSILVGDEYAIPFHVGYYRQIQERSTDLIRAYYSADLGDLERLIQKYGVDFLLIGRTASDDEHSSEHTLMRQFGPMVEDVRGNMRRGSRPALSRVIDRCAVFSTGNLIVLEADCIVRAARE